MRERVIFIDCDGVLNTRLTHERVGRFLGLEPALLDRFASVVRASAPVSVVVSSTWRLLPDMYRALCSELHQRGIAVHDTTPEIGSRGADIGAWLVGHPEVERFAIIDDDRDILPQHVHSAFFTTFEDGLTDEIAAAVVAHLLVAEPTEEAGNG